MISDHAFLLDMRGMCQYALEMKGVILDALYFLGFENNLDSLAPLSGECN